MAVMKELLIGQDEQRSNNPIDCTVVEAPKATSVMDAIRMACANLGIDHDVAECIAAGTQARMPAKEAFFICPDGSAPDSLYVSDNGRPRLVTAEELCKRTIEDTIRSADPGAYMHTRRYIFGTSRFTKGQHSWLRTKADAEELAAAIIAASPGVSSITDKPGLWLDVEVQDGRDVRDFVLYYSSEEAPPCTAS